MTEAPRPQDQITAPDTGVRPYLMGGLVGVAGLLLWAAAGVAAAVSATRHWDGAWPGLVIGIASVGTLLFGQWTIGHRLRRIEARVQQVMEDQDQTLASQRAGRERVAQVATDLLARLEAMQELLTQQSQEAGAEYYQRATDPPQVVIPGPGQRSPGRGTVVALDRPS